MLSSSSKNTLSLVLINLDLAIALNLQSGSGVKSVHIDEALRTIIWHREKFSKCQLMLTRFFKVVINQNFSVLVKIFIALMIKHYDQKAS